MEGYGRTNPNKEYFDKNHSVMLNQLESLVSEKEFKKAQQIYSRIFGEMKEVKDWAAGSSNYKRAKTRLNNYINRFVNSYKIATRSGYDVKPPFDTHSHTLYNRLRQRIAELEYGVSGKDIVKKAYDDYQKYYKNHKNPYEILHEEGHEGKFTTQFKNRKSKYRHLTSLSEFAHYILQHPDEFQLITRKRANYYVNLLESHRPPPPPLQFPPPPSPISHPSASSKPQRNLGIPFEGHFEPSHKHSRPSHPLPEPPKPVPKPKSAPKPKSPKPLTAAKLKKLQKEWLSLTKRLARYNNIRTSYLKQKKLEKEPDFYTKLGRRYSESQYEEAVQMVKKLREEIEKIDSIEGFDPPDEDSESGGLRGGSLRDILRWIYDYTQPPMSHDEFFQRARERRITDAEAQALKDELLADRRLLQAHEAYLKAERENRNKKEAIARLREQQIRSAEEYGVWEMPDQEFQEARDRYNRLAEQSAQIQAEDPDWEAVEDPQFWTSWKGTGRCHRAHRMIGGKLTSKEFQHMLKASYKPSAERENIGDYVLDNSLSTDEVAVYHNPKTGDTKVVYRGTKGLKDWANNLALVFGQYNKTDRYKRGKKIYEDVVNKYGTNQLDVLGHSQGAHLAKELGKNAKSVVTLNEAVHPFYNNEHPNQTHIRSSNDIISGLNYLNPYNWGKKYITIPSENINPREEHRPQILERLPENTILGNGRRFCMKGKGNLFGKPTKTYVDDVEKVMDVMHKDGEMRRTLFTPDGRISMIKPEIGSLFLQAQHEIVGNKDVWNATKSELIKKWISDMESILGDKISNLTKPQIREKLWKSIRTDTPQTIIHPSMNSEF